MTYAQQLASNPDSSVYVSASAGSGKTKVLTDRVLRILLSGTPPGKIMCLTFTNAAAAEMANRINKSLMQWVVASDEELYKSVADLTSSQPSPKILELARRLFVEVLDTPDGLKIQTIHSFCQNLMRRFPLEAGIPPHFQVVDPRTSLELLKEARMRLLAGNDEYDENVKNAINNIAWRLHEGSFTDLLKEITNEREKIEYLLSKHLPDQIIANIYKTLGVVQGETESGLIKAAYRDGELRDNLKNASRILLEGSKTDVERGQIIADFMAHEAPDEDAFNNYKEAFLTDKDEPRKRLITDVLGRDNPHIAEILLRQQQHVITLDDRLKSIRVANLSRDLFYISKAILTLYKKLKQAKAYLDYNDLIISSNKLLHMQDIAPWILYKLDGGIDHLLVDEAQDTSPAQWQVIEALCEEFFTGEGAATKNRTVFIVGDEKQSIFSFQGADPQVFHKMQEVFADRAANAQKGWESISLDMSFRSTDPVLQAVDAVFASPQIKSAITFKLEEIKHVAYRNQYAGRVELWDLVEKAEKTESPRWTMPISRVEPDNAKKQLAEEIATAIKDWLDNGRKLESQGRKIEPGDIMILVQKRDALVDYLVRGLKKRGVPVAGVDRMVLTDHIVIQDLIALGNFLLLPQDNLNLAALLKSPLIGLSEEQLFDLAHGREGVSLWDRIRNQESGIKNQESRFQIPDSCTYLSELLSKTDFLSPFALYSYVLEAKSGRKQFTARLGMEVNDPINEFLSLAMDYESSHPPSLQGFLHWLTLGDAEVKRDLDQGNNEVRIMTVHGSKGLQAPIVFIPDTTSLPNNKTNNIFWTTDGEPVMLWSGRSSGMNTLCRNLRDAEKNITKQEYLRLLYVAMTRAEDELYITGYKSGKGVSEECWYNVIKSGIEKIAAKEGDKLVVTSNQLINISNDNISAGASPKQTSLPEFVTTPLPPEPSPSIPLSPSQMGEDTYAVQSPLKSKSVLRGKLIHKLLEYLPDIADSEREILAKKFLDKYNKELSDIEQSEILSSVSNILKNKDIVYVFGAGSKAEVPISGVLGKYVLSGRIDRLLVTETEVLVIDYKTSRTPPKNGIIPQNYLKQMASYKIALQQIYPDKTIRCAVIWTEVPEVVMLQNDILQEFVF
jgi:ATP-dependent helicase/nuclease subunit A